MKRFLFWKRAPARPAGRPAEPARTAAAQSSSEGSGLLTGDPREDARSLQILLDTIGAVTANIDVDSVLHDIVARSLQVTQAERALLFLGDNPDALAVRVAQGREGEALPADQQWSRTVVRRCLEERQAVRSVVQSDREALELGQSVYDLKLRAVMCAPLIAAQRVVGVIYVDSRAMRREFSARDLALFSAISAQLAISLENARLHADSIEKVRLQKDVEIAQRIQRHLMPTVPKAQPGVDLALRYFAVEHASGDTYDFVPLDGGRLAVMVGDVTGHGIGAALLMHAAQAALRSYFELIDDLSLVVTRLNQRLVAAVETGNFMSLLVCIVDPAGRAVRFVNAGHPGLVHVSGGQVTALEKTGMVLGVVGGQEYAVSPTVKLSPGDLLFLHTDGVDEAMSPARETFGEARLHTLLRQLAGKPAEAVLAGIEQALRAHTGGTFGDDFTMIAVRIT
jgi:serine phosphatase RsbU (regulator of sigma subunit)